MTENNDSVINQLIGDIAKAADNLFWAHEEIKNLQGQLAVLRAELVVSRDEIRRLLEHHELLTAENNVLRRRLSDLRYQYQRDFQGDL